jgi:hypothetical protein
MSCVAYVYGEHGMCHRPAATFRWLTCRLARGHHRRLPLVRRKLPDFRHIIDGRVAAGAHRHRQCQGWQQTFRYVGDVPELRAHPRGDDDRQSLTGRDRSAGQQHVGLLGERAMRGFQIRACIAAPWDRFARQRGVVHAHVKRFDQAAVGGYLIALGQRDHIARNQRRGGQIADDPIAQDTHGRRKEPLQRLDCMVRLSVANS